MKYLKKHRRVKCSCCGRQIVPYCKESTRYQAPGIGARVGFTLDEGFCGDCAQDMDENGLFPEERD